MAIIGMRELLRDPTKVFSEIEEKGEPFLVTNRGRPVAAMYPVDSSRAEQLLLATAPEYLESRRSAERARTEGRTRSLESAIEEYNAGVEPDEQIETEETEPEFARPLPAVTAQDDLVPMAELKAIFGAELACEIATEADRRISTLSESLVGSAEIAGLLDAESTEGASGRREVIAQVRELDAELFGNVMREVLMQEAKERIAAFGVDTPASRAVGPDGLFDRQFAEETIETAAAYVRQFHQEILAPTHFQPTSPLLITYAASIRGATTLGRFGHAGAAQAAFIRPRD
jgi:antitoxin (DNA-binding transcriptional repressor) of toxin-antitoxin stability system